MIWDQWSYLSKDPLKQDTSCQCTGLTTKSKGILCSCKLYEIRVSGRALEASNIDPHWYLTKPTGVINSSRAPVLDPLPAKVGGRKRITKAKGKGRGVTSTTRDLSTTLAIDMFNLTPWGASQTDDNGNGGRKRALTLSALVSTTLKRVRTPNPPVPLINPNINPATGKLWVLNQPNRQRTPPATTLATITTPLRTFTLPISPLKPNTRAEYDIIRERLEAYGDSYSAGTRPSEGYLWKQYKMNIKGERTQVYLEARKTTTPLSTMTEALDCDSESQIRRWAHGDDELVLSQLDS
jgi:hypothetical protein